MQRLINWLRQIFNPHWYNFDTDHYDFIAPIDLDYAPYLPKGPARNLYHLYIDHQGLSPLDAGIKVLETCITMKDKKE